MIDPLGPDPTDPVLPARQVAEIVSEFETPGSLSPLRPKVRYANYDSPEAQLRKEPPRIEDSSRRPEASARNQASPRAGISPRAEAPPRIQEASLPTPASTALARPMPPKPTRLERAMSVARTVLPIVGKMLPLLEGNVVGAASNLFANRPMHEVDLKPLEESISRLQSDHRALAFHSGEQKRALQRLEDDFATLQEIVQKNAADQAELIEHVAKLAKRTSSFMRLVTILLVISILFTVLLCVRIAYMIRF